MYKVIINIIASIVLMPFLACAQQNLTGSVFNTEDNLPLEGANVYINSASKGTVTGKDGRFELTNLSLSNFELVVSYVGFQTLVVQINPANINKQFRIGLSRKKAELTEIIIGVPENNGWANYGKLFTDLFIGTSANATHCKILNPGVVNFYFNKKQNEVTASASAALVIENNALGYTINYDLEKFNYNFTQKVMYYSGYSNFTEMVSTNSRKMERWKKNRREAYNGSIMHFMRSLYDSSLTREGFIVRELIRLFKSDSTTSDLYNSIMKGNYSKVDTSKYFVQVLKARNIFRDPEIYLFNKLLMPTNMIRYVDAGEVMLTFPYNLSITYKNELEKTEYLQQRIGISNLAYKFTRHNQHSIIGLPNARPVVVYKSGLFYDPLDLYTEEYWAWEKIAEMLPADYVVE